MIVHADVLDVPLESFDSIDVLITDPPYSDHVHANMVSHGTGGVPSVARDPGFACLTPELRMRIAEIGARVRRWSVVFSDLESQGAWRADFAVQRVEYIRQEIWTRWSQPQKSGDRPPSCNEAILVYHPRGAKHWNGPGSRMSYTHKALRGDEKHPTEKPLDLMLDLVSAYSDPGETVLDPCGGAGTTAVACALLGRDAVVFERDARWAAAAERRATGHLSEAELARVREWCSTTADEATRAASVKPDATNVQTRARAARRLADVERVAGALP